MVPNPEQFSPDLLKEELERLCASSLFKQSERLKRFVRYAVQMSIEGNHERLKESVIGTEVFDRPLGYNPKEDAIVRVEAHRLRQKLDQYYARQGASTKLRFVLPKGQYLILIEPQAAAPDTPPGQPASLPPPSPTARTWKIVAAVALLFGLLAGVWFASRGGRSLKMQPSAGAASRSITAMPPTRCCCQMANP